ncbi:NADPH-dependent 7-cyano-7-deazaguanine reductase QueF, partial [Paraferrimonas sp. SM1919]|uniref:NADPH-dependent 7-cyano-7-deazaguanine reductase QueF n=1 Tax=Paraferrimonas sp. SM1919 TaxID=2662263 RepID=UPI0013D64E50
TGYVSEYAPELLQGVPRSLNRDALALDEKTTFDGADLWTCFEISWLNPKGKPHVAIANVEVPAASPNLIESKSFKLYLNSFNQTKIASIDELQQTIAKDLSCCAGAEVKVELIPANQFHLLKQSQFTGTNIDDLDISMDDYHFNPDYLVDAADQNQIVTEALTSDLLKSNCLITSQPDWGSVYIHYHGPKINQEALLKYLISFRDHNEFHEQCVERIFTDLIRYCHCQKLTVYARYTRRGGLDINPYRSNFEATPKHNDRQARQ